MRRRRRLELPSGRPAAQVVQHLDNRGIERLGLLLESMPHATVLLTSQADSEATGMIDKVRRRQARGSL